VQRLVGAKGYLHIILGNTGTDDAENKPARQTLHDAGIDITDRFVANNHIAHNKFCLYVDKTNKPRAVLTGSTNWTSTGVCTQSNNAVVIESDDLAKAYFDYWNLLKKDGGAQAQPLRTADMTSHDATIDGAEATVWYSPHTKQTAKPANNPDTPPDMKAVFDAMATKHLMMVDGRPKIFQIDPCGSFRSSAFFRMTRASSPLIATTGRHGRCWCSAAGLRRREVLQAPIGRHA
jgi:hypothetical protein